MSTFSSMNCVSCGSKINPKWRHAVQNNSCPYCGESIMDEELKGLLLTLESTFENLSENYSDQLDYWLSANYGYSKHGKPRPKFTEDGDLEVDENHLSKFMKNAPVKVDTSEQRKESLREKIKQAKSGESEFLFSNDDDLEVDVMGTSDLSQSYSSALGGQEDYEDKIHPAALALANSKKGGKAIDPRTIASMNKVAERQNLMADLGEVGLIKRS